MVFVDTNVLMNCVDVSENTGIQQSLDKLSGNSQQDGTAGPFDSSDILLLAVVVKIRGKVV
jgi:hypothetical protein